MADLTLKRVAKLRVAYVELTGPYENWGRGLMGLKKLLDEQKVKVVGKPIGLFYNNPLDTPPEKLRSDACMPIPDDATVYLDGAFKVKELSAAEVATVIHAGPVERYTDSYGAMFQSILANGYRWNQPAREIFDSPREDLRPGMGVQIQQPVFKA